MSTLRATTVDLDSEAVWRDPFTFYSRIRESKPVFWHESTNTWLITRHADVAALLRDPGVFSSRISTDASWEQLAPGAGLDQEFLFNDPPWHTEVRRLLHLHFTPSAVGRLREQVRSFATALLDALPQESPSDFKEHFAIPLPLLVMAELLDVPRADASLMRELTDLIHAGDRQGWRRFVDYFTPIIEYRHNSPGEDLISALVRGEKDGILTRDQTLANVRLLMVAGHHTTINLICNGLLAFAERPESWAELRRDPPGLMGTAVEECLRFDPPIPRRTRVATCVIALHGQTIRPGETVSWIISAANRDPRVFDEPDSFRTARKPNPHLSFGVGIHHCLGAALARLEGQEAFRVIAERRRALVMADHKREYEAPHRQLKSLMLAPVPA